VGGGGVDCVFGGAGFVGFGVVEGAGAAGGTASQDMAPAGDESSSENGE